MNAQLNQSVLETVVNANVSDHDARSALGMARSAVANGKAIERQPYHQGQFKKRDDLAEALVEVMAEADPADCIAALAEARARINAPFTDPTMNGQRFGKAVIEKPGGRNDQTG